MDNKKYVGLWVRMGASFWDILYLAPFIFVFVVLKLNFPASDLLITIIGHIIIALYYILLMSGARQATLGMRKEGIKIVNLSGNKISLMRSMFRYVLSDAIYFFNNIANISDAWSISLEVFFTFMQLMMAFHPRKQAYYDIICGTYVVYDDNKK